jgi:hypothetical protein
MTMANWNDDLYDAYVGLGQGSGMGSFVYFALVIILGNWMLFNLFVAILLQKFFAEKEKLDNENAETMRMRIVHQLGSLSEEDLAAACEDLFVLMDNNSSGGVDVYELEDGLASHWAIKFSTETLISMVCLFLFVSFFLSRSGFLGTGQRA